MTDVWLPMEGGFEARNLRQFRRPGTNGTYRCQVVWLAQRAGGISALGELAMRRLTQGQGPFGMLPVIWLRSATLHSAAASMVWGS
jgi:hypothetical protein